MVEQNFLNKIIPFFIEGTDFSKIGKPTDVLDLNITELKDFDPNWAPFFEEADDELKTIKDLAQSKDDLVIEGLNPDNLKKQQSTEKNKKKSSSLDWVMQVKLVYLRFYPKNIQL
ncbi:MAG: hypothetical protein ACTSPA_01125 [Promethearchaeota archaeon]